MAGDAERERGDFTLTGPKLHFAFEPGRVRESGSGSGASEEGHFLPLSLSLPAKKCFRSFLLEGYLNMNRAEQRRAGDGRGMEGPILRPSSNSSLDSE